MKKVAKAILIALGIILVVGALTVLGVNLYVQSAGTHARIEHGLGTGLHSPVKIGSLSFMPWYGLKLSSISRDGAADGNFIEISSIGVRLQLFKLLRRNVVIKELSVDGLKVSWTQNAEGKWQMPGAPAVATTEPPEANTTQPAPPPLTPPVPLPQASPASAPPPPVSVDHARLRDASFSFYDKNHKPIAVLTGVFVQTPSPTDQMVIGTAAVSRVVIQNKFRIADYNGSFKYTPEELSLFDTSCKVDGGTANTKLDVKIARQNSPFVLDTDFSGINLDRLLADAGVTDLQASGAISGYLHLEGDSRDSKNAKGKGQIVLADGYVTKSDLMESLSGWLHTDKLRGLSFQDAHANFHIDGGGVYFDELVLKSTPLWLSGNGVMATDGNNLFVQFRLSISADIARQIPDYLLQNFGKDGTSGARYVDFGVTGDINHPKSDLLKVVGKHMSLKQGVNAIWNNFKQPQPPPAAPPPQPVPPNP